MPRPEVLVLGAGPAGLGAAFRLIRRGVADVTVLERNGWLGGNTASFDLAGVRVDYGSHRLHRACDPRVLHDIRELLGDDLLERRRHGLIHLQGRWIHFPLRPLDLLLRLPPTFTLGLTVDLLQRVLSVRSGAHASSRETFASVLESTLGRTICRDFYFPYAQKIWGLPPDKLSPIQARRRVSHGSMGTLLRKLLRPAGLSGNLESRFFYPRHGYGQICDAYGRAIAEAGGTIYLNAQVTGIETTPDGAVVRYEQGGQQRSIAAGAVWSTIPITALVRALEPAPPAVYRDAADAIEYRAMILVYLVLRQDRYGEFDAYYFPEPDVPIARLSEPKSFSDGYGAPDVTVLCAELPCSPDDPVWGLGDDELGELVRTTLQQVGRPVTAEIAQVATRRIRHAYPLYRVGFEAYFNLLDAWVSGRPRLLTFGRQGLFSHDNLHHALDMGYCAADCLTPDGSFDHRRWHDYRREFETHVVED